MFWFNSLRIRTKPIVTEKSLAILGENKTFGFLLFAYMYIWVARAHAIFGLLVRKYEEFSKTAETFLTWISCENFREYVSVPFFAFALNFLLGKFIFNISAATSLIQNVEKLFMIS